MTDDTTPVPPRRDFLLTLTGALGAVGCCAAAWPFLDSLSPPDTLETAAPPVTLDLGTVAPGGQHVLSWNGHPVFVVHRTDAELAFLREAGTVGDAAGPGLPQPPSSPTPRATGTARCGRTTASMSASARISAASRLSKERDTIAPATAPASISPAAFTRVRRPG